MNKRAILTIWPGTTTSNKEGKMSFEPTYKELKLSEHFGINEDDTLF